MLKWEYNISFLNFSVFHKQRYFAVFIEEANTAVLAYGAMYQVRKTSVGIC